MATELTEDQRDEELKEQYWTSVREEFDKIVDQEFLDDDLIEEAFQVADGSDGQGGSTSPEAEAESIKLWIVDKLCGIGVNEEVLAQIFVEAHRKAHLMSDPCIFMEVSSGELTLNPESCQPDTTILLEKWEPKWDQPKQDATEAEVEAWAKAWADTFCEEHFTDVEDKLRDYWNIELSK